MQLYYERGYNTVKEDKACGIYFIFQHAHTGLPEFHNSRRYRRETRDVELRNIKALGPFFGTSAHLSDFQLGNIFAL